MCVCVKPAHTEQCGLGYCSETLSCLSLVSCRVHPRPPCRWCATGTPAGGDITDLLGQFCVLNLRPFTDWTFFSVFVRSAYSGSMQTRGVAHLLLYILGRCMIRHTKLQVAPAYGLCSTCLTISMVHYLACFGIASSALAMQLCPELCLMVSLPRA